MIQKPYWIEHYWTYEDKWENLSSEPFCEGDYENRKNGVPGRDKKRREAAVDFKTVDVQGFPFCICWLDEQEVHTDLY